VNNSRITSTPAATSQPIQSAMVSSVVGSNG
jgi:hypothetical protein